MKYYFFNYTKIKKNNPIRRTLYDTLKRPVDKSFAGSSQQVPIVKGKE